MNQKHMDKISLKIHKGFRIKESHPRPQPSRPPSALGLSVGNSPPLHGLPAGIAHPLATQPAPSFSPAILPHLLWFSGQVAGVGWEERSTGEKDEWEEEGRCGEQASQVLRRGAMCCMLGRMVFVATGWFHIWGALESSSRCFFSF